MTIEHNTKNQPERKSSINPQAVLDRLEKIDEIENPIVRERKREKLLEELDQIVAPQIKGDSISPCSENPHEEQLINGQ